MSSQLITDTSAIPSIGCIVAAIVALHLFVIAVDFWGAVSIFTNRFQVSRLRWWQRLYLAVVFGKSLSLILCDSCPLTMAENFFRSQGEVNTAYNDSFVSHYLPYMPSEIDILLTCVLMMAGLFAVLRYSHQRITITPRG